MISKVQIDRSRPIDPANIPELGPDWRIESEDPKSLAISELDLERVMRYDAFGFKPDWGYGRRNGYKRTSPSEYGAKAETHLTTELRIQRAKEDKVVLLDAGIALALLKPENRQALEQLTETFYATNDCFEFGGTVFVNDNERSRDYDRHLVLGLRWVERCGEACVRGHREPFLAYFHWKKDEGIWNHSFYSAIALRPK